MKRIVHWMVLAVLAAVVATTGVVSVAPTAEALGAGAIVGMVSDGVTGISGVAVRAYDAPTGAFVEKTTTDAAGHYSLPDLPVGGYKVLVNGTAQNWQVQWHGGAASMAGATVVPVSDGSTPTADVVLVPGGAIQGTLQAFLVGPCTSGVPVRVYDETGRTLVAKTTSSYPVGGAYYVGGLPPGSYLVRFGDASACNIAWWAPVQWGVASRLDAVPIQVLAGASFQADIVLMKTMRLHGVATDSSTGVGIAGLDVRMYYAWDEGFARIGALQAKTTTGADGSYDLPTVRAGISALRFSDPNGRYQLEWYKDQSTFDSAWHTIVYGGESMELDPVLTLIGQVSAG